MSGKRGLTIGELARSSGVNLETVRYYERIGLMPAPARSEGGHRLYEPDHGRRLAFIRRARELGFPIEDIRTLLALADEDAPCGQVVPLARLHLESVRARIADLQRLEAILAASVDRCSTTIGGPNCAVLEMLEQA